MVGQTFAHYDIEALVGAGGMGVVYRARDTHLRRTVALKFLASEHADAAAGKRLLTEARAISSLNHPNICTVYEVIDVDDQTCIVMEYVDGQPLSKLISPAQGLAAELVISYGSQIADALAHAHQRGVVHPMPDPAATRLRRRSLESTSRESPERFPTWRQRCCAARRLQDGATSGPLVSCCTR